MTAMADRQQRNEESATAPEQPEAPPSTPRFTEDVVGRLEGILGYAFDDRALLDEAMTHASYYYPFKGAGATYERLEFMGDAVLNCLVARHFMAAYPDLPPGPLTKLRAANVDTERLARVAVANGLHRYVWHKAPRLDQMIEEFMKDMLEFPVHSNGMLDTPKILADIIEALLGAIFIDSNNSLDIVWKVFCKLAEPLITMETLGKHPMSELYEFCQKNKLKVKIRDHKLDESIRIEILVNDKLFEHTTYGRKKEIAQNRASKAVLEKLKKSLGDMIRDGNIN